MTMMTMTIERVRAFNGLDVLVARDEGLFAAEGLDLRIAALPAADIRSTADGSLARIHRGGAGGHGLPRHRALQHQQAGVSGAVP